MCIIERSFRIIDNKLRNYIVDSNFPNDQTLYCSWNDISCPLRFSSKCRIRQFAESQDQENIEQIDPEKFCMLEAAVDTPLEPATRIIGGPNIRKN